MLLDQQKSSQIETNMSAGITWHELRMLDMPNVPLGLAIRHQDVVHRFRRVERAAVDAHVQLPLMSNQPL